MNNNHLLDVMFGNLDLKEYVQVDSSDRNLYLQKLQDLTASKESRLRFAAYKEIRNLNEQSRDINLNEVLGFIMEVGVAIGKIDRIAVYPDGRARYYGFDGKMAIWEPQLSPITKLIMDILSNVEPVFSNTLSWKDDYQKDLMQAYIRFTVLTPNGYKNIDGEFSKIASAREYQNIIKSATQLIQMLKKVS